MVHRSDVDASVDLMNLQAKTVLLDEIEFHPPTVGKSFRANRYTSNGPGGSTQYLVDFVTVMPFSGDFDDAVTILSDDVNVTIQTN